MSVPTAIPNVPAIRHDVSMTGCSVAKGGWTSRGTVANDSGAARRYRITVLFTNTAATVVGVGRTSLRVAAGGTAEWTITARTTQAATTLCVLSGVA